MSIRSQGTALFSFILGLVALTVVLQLWLLTVSMEALLSHRTQMLLPSAVGSLVLLGINALLLRFVFRFDNEVKQNGQGF